MEKNKYKNYIIQTGIGLQDVDQLKNSTNFLIESDRYIKGENSFDEGMTLYSYAYEVEMLITFRFIIFLKIYLQKMEKLLVSC